MLTPLALHHLSTSCTSCTCLYIYALHAPASTLYPLRLRVEGWWHRGGMGVRVSARSACESCKHRHVRASACEAKTDAYKTRTHVSLVTIRLWGRGAVRVPSLSTCSLSCMRARHAPCRHACVHDLCACAASLPPHLRSFAGGCPSCALWRGVVVCTCVGCWLL